MFDTGHKETSTRGSSCSQSCRQHWQKMPLWCEQEQREEGEEALHRGRFTHLSKEGSEKQKEN